MPVSKLCLSPALPEPKGRSRLTRRVWCLLALFVASTGLMALACARETRHEWLVFFYDGVPPLTGDLGDSAEDQTTDDSADNATRAKMKTKYFTHPLHLQNRCAECHQEDRVLKIPVREGLCRMCHFDKPEEKMAFLHGPFAVNECLSCHRMHKSEHKGILLADAQDVCFFCHEMGNLVVDEHHEEIESKRCIECHNPHGGGDRYFLQPEVAKASAKPGGPAVEGS